MRAESIFSNLVRLPHAMVPQAVQGVVIHMLARTNDCCVRVKFCQWPRLLSAGAFLQIGGEPKQVIRLALKQMVHGQIHRLCDHASEPLNQGSRCVGQGPDQRVQDSPRWWSGAVSCSENSSEQRTTVAIVATQVRVRHQSRHRVFEILVSECQNTCNGVISSD